MKRLGWSVVLAITLAGFAPAPAQAVEESALVTAARATPAFYPDGITWEVVVEQWEGKEMAATQHVKLQTKGDSTLAEFVAPAKVVGRKLLMKDRGMWFMKPGLLKPVPISPRQRLLGSASYGDLVSINYARDYTVTSAGEEQLDGEACHVFALAARERSAVYPRLKHWVSKTRKVGVRTEYFGETGGLLKWATFDFGNAMQRDGRPYAFLSRAVIHDPNAVDSVAVLRFGRVQMQPLSDATFDLNLLTQ